MGNILANPQIFKYSLIVVTSNTNCCYKRMKNTVLLFLLFFLPVFVFAQQQYSTTNKEAIKNFALANESIDEHQYNQAIQQLQKAVAEDDHFIEAHAQLGDIMHLARDNKGSIVEFKKVIALNPDFSRAV